jgi:antitoxin HicB
MTSPHASRPSILVLNAWTVALFRYLRHRPRFGLGALDTPMKKASQNAQRGSDFRDFLDQEGILPEVEVLALKRVVSLQLQQILEQEHVTKTELASRMKTSRASLDQMLDPSNPSLTVASLGKAAAALGRKVELRFVCA